MVWSPVGCMKALVASRAANVFFRFLVLFGFKKNKNKKQKGQNLVFLNLSINIILQGTHLTVHSLFIDLRDCDNNFLFKFCLCTAMYIVQYNMHNVICTM